MPNHDLVEQYRQLPATIPDLAKFTILGREKLNAIRAEIRAIDKLGVGISVHQQKMEEAQLIAELVLDAEVQLGQLISKLEKTPGKRSDIEPMDGDVRKSKKEQILDVGMSVKQAQRLEKIAEHPEVVKEAIENARNNNQIVTRSDVIHLIDDKKPYIINNSGNAEWYTPERYIKSARKVMGSIDLDPASSNSANQVVKATTFYTAETDGLTKEWSGNIWLNPPYSDSGKFVSKLCESDIDQAIVLVNNATETGWFEKLVANASAIVFHKGRLRFRSPEGSETSAPMQGQAFIYIGKNSKKFLKEFSKYGWGTLLTWKK